MDLQPISTDFYFKNSLDVKALVSSSIELKITNYIVSTYPMATLIYTDGSRSVSGRAGAAVYIPSLDISLSYRLSDNVRTDFAELDAIFSAISLIILHHIVNPVIITDSLSILTTFSNASIFDNALVHICRDLISSNNLFL